MLTPAHVSTKIQRYGDAPTIGRVRRRRRLVRIAYLDEAGTSSETAEPFLVVGGVLVHGDNDWYPVETHANQIIKNYVPATLREGFSFHAMHLFGGNKKYQDLIPPDVRFQILREVLGIIATFELPVSYGAITRSELTKEVEHWNVSERVDLAQQLALSLCLFGFQGWFNRESGDEVAICVASETEKKRLRAHLKQDYAMLRKRGFPNFPLVTLFNFVDALHFTAAEESIGLQLADCATFAIKRHLMGKEDSEEFYKLIEKCLVCDPVSALWPIAPET
jgi:hypothetical protein